MTVGEAMRKAREAKGFTQRKLAAKVGITNTTISNCETDRHYPNLFTVISIADVLGISLDDLVGRVTH